MDGIRQQIIRDMKARGVRAVARERGMTREALMAYCLGVSTEGTVALVEKRDAAERARKSQVSP
jgi:hypothetical protein